MKLTRDDAHERMDELLNSMKKEQEIEVNLDNFLQDSSIYEDEDEDSVCFGWVIMYSVGLPHVELSIKNDWKSYNVQFCDGSVHDALCMRDEREYTDDEVRAERKRWFDDYVDTFKVQFPETTKKFFFSFSIETDGCSYEENEL